jgi:hypothetical protein
MLEKKAIMSSKLDRTARKMQSIIDDEKKFSYGNFLLSLRCCLGLTKQAVSYDLDLDYDDLCRHENETMSKRFDTAKNAMLAEYYEVDPALLERKFREWQKAMPAKHNGKK